MNIPRDLKTEYKKNPLGMDETAPRFSYQLQDNITRQTSYRIIVTDPQKKTVWDSGTVNSSICTQIVYQGEKLLPFTRYTWSVQVTDENGKRTKSKENAFFETGFLGTKWSGKWIFGRNGHCYKSPVQRFIRRFELNKKVVSARLYTTALGIYEASINGTNVTDDLFTPGWTDYYHRVQYQAYDVTKLLKTGINILADMLAEGWFCGGIVRQNFLNEVTYGPFPALCQELHLRYADGSEEVIASDDSFRVCSSFPALKLSDIYMGEIYDAAEETHGWKTAETPVENEYPAKILEDRFQEEFFAKCPDFHPKRLPEIVWNSGAPVREIMTIAPVSIKFRKKSGTFIVDFGQNLTGRERFTLPRTYQGTCITIRHGEMLNADGSLYCRNLRSAAAETVYHAADSRKRVVYEPHFTFYGFRYLEISGWPGELKKDQIEAVVIHSDLPETGYFECSNELINKLFSNIFWGQRSNFLDIPTDCPQRDERLGWTGDTQVFANEASYNMFCPEFYTKWIHDLNCCRTKEGGYTHIVPNPFGWNDFAAGWADAAFICPDVMLKKYGDLRLIETYFDNMKNYLLLQIRKAGGKYIVRNACFKDWLNMDDPTSEELISTAYLAGMSKLLAHHAELLGKSEDQKELLAIAKKVRTAYQKEFFTNGSLKEKSQTAALMTLNFDLAPEESYESVCADLLNNIRSRENHLSTGFLGTPLLLNVLTKIGQVDLAYEILQQTTCPGWLYPVTQGATTMWERWNSWNEKTGFADIHMNSFNHYAYGAVGEWFYETICGIRPLSDTLDQVGFHQFQLEPHFGNALTFANATYFSSYGPIVSAWTRENGNIYWAFCVPQNTTALIRLDNAENILKEAGFIKQKTGTYLAGPGEYALEIKESLLKGTKK